MTNALQEKFGYDFCTETLELKVTIENSFLELGQRLSRIRGDGLFLGQWSSFAEYLGEMKMSESTASKLINIYDKFIVQFGFPAQRLLSAGGWGVIAEILPFVKTKEDGEHWLNELEHHSREDIRILRNIAKTGIKPEDCSHSETYTLTICKNCGNKQKVYEEELA